MAQGAASPAPPTPPAGSIGPHSPRSGSSFFDRFGRRPRTANSTHNRNPSASLIHQAGGNNGGMPSTFSTESLTGTPTPSSGQFARQQAQQQQQQQQSSAGGLPRSSSSSNINQNNFSFPRDTHASPPATPPAINQNRNPMNAVGAAASSPAQGSSSGTGAFGRMFRRYSHGAGKNSSQDAAAAARESARSGGAGPSSGTGASSAASPPAGTNSPSGRPSALRSLSNHFLPSSSSLSLRANPNAESLTRTLSNQIAAVSGGMSAAGAPRSSVDGYAAALGRSSGHNSVGAGGSSADVGATTSAHSGASASNDASAGGAGASANPPNQDSASGQAGPSTSTSANSPNPSQGYRIRLVPHLEASRSLHFEPVERELRDGAPAIKIGRFTERGNAANSAAAAAAASSAAASTGPSREGLGTASGPGTGSAVATLAAQNRGALTDVDMAGAAAPAAAGSSGPSGAAESVSAVLAQGRRQPERSRANNKLDARIAFKSKVVSRGHAEIWCENGGNFFLRDTKSSSGTFLNHIRLSAPGVESRPFRIKDGDVVQLGVDYQGGTEEIYRCVKMRVELNRGWQREANQYNVNALRQLRALQGSPMPATPSGNEADKALTAEAAQGATVSAVQQPPTSVTDCCICLFSVTVCQALFIAPCSHVFHYKCIRPLLAMHHPGFSCPLCRTFADLEADVEQDEEWQADLMRQATQGIEPAATPSIAAAPLAAPAAEPMSTQPTLAAGTTGAAPAAAPHPLATVLESHSRRSSHEPSQNGLQRNAAPAADGDHAMAVESNQRTSLSGRSHAEDDDEDDQEVLQDDEDELMEDFSGPSGRQSGAEDESEGEDASASQGSQAGAFSQPANLSLSASGSLAARRSLQNAGSSTDSDGAGTGVSAPISMPISATAPIPGSAGLEEARTPMNQHFLSTLAESSPGGPAFFNAAAAARVAAQSASAAAAAARNGPSSSTLGVGANGTSGGVNGHASGDSDEVDVEADRSTPGAGGPMTATMAGAKRSAHDALESARRSSGSGGVRSSADDPAGSAPTRDEVMSD
ncbi:hypothetical protein OC834_006905 [Tilletia horrida]|uniref:Uncharacterized protein n=1 Tax=Tilletia horrida TaxID=155126 RepID=A0AAN6GBC2_9BASI|nr:hypothetical protein OC834_006905 [Tilletia horrida]KAK0531393.1 hypothetical protein OC842_003639 [Tilletia horrida]